MACKANVVAHQYYYMDFDHSSKHIDGDFTCQYQSGFVNYLKRN